MLETRNVSVFYGRHRALENVSASVSKGEIVVMLGANGAGKSTFLRAVAGQTRKMDGGTVLMDGADITRRPSHEIVETGIALVPEDRGIFADLTVQENLILGAHPVRARALEAQNIGAGSEPVSEAQTALEAARAHHERRRAADGGDRDGR